jgi:Icc-related predicted phosphoesterase
LKILLYSDLHLEFDFAPFTPPAVECDVVVLAGDIWTKGRGPAWARKAFGDRPVVMVAGNHELYAGHWTHSLAKLRRRAAQHDVHFLENDQVKIAGVRFLGCSLWTDFALYGQELRAKSMLDAQAGLNDYMRIKAVRSRGDINDVVFGGGRLTPGLVARRHWESVEWLSEKLNEPFEGKTVVVSHHAPSILSVPENLRQDPLTPAYASDLERLFGKADLWCHGHIHESVDYTVGGTRVVSNPRGYPDEDRLEGMGKQFDPSFVVEI